MFRILVTVISIIVVLAIYKMQHVKPVDDPKDSPIFQQRLQTSLKKFQENELSAGERAKPTPQSPSKSFPATRPTPRTKDLVVSGRCGKTTITWVEEKKIDKETIIIKRKAGDAEYSPLADKRIFDREEEGGVRYWASDSGLTDGVSYEYRISFKNPQGKEVVKEPASIDLTCTEQDREIVAQGEKMIKEYYQKQGIDPKKYAALPPSKPEGASARINDVLVSGRCSRVTLTWVEEQKIAQEKITVKRKDGEGDYVPLVGKNIYEREEEEGGVRYWLSDSGLADGKTYEYLVSFLDSQGKESVKKPVSINLTCTERDREIVAQREKMIKEYYEQKGLKPRSLDSAKPPSYTLSEEVHQVDLRESPHKGKEGAPVTLVVFTDFECVYCSTWSETLESMLKTFPDDIKIVYKNFPLSYHKQAKLAAAAALAAREQGKFWEMHNLLYRNRTALTRADILGYAKELKLDSAQFEKSLAGEEITQLINQDKTQGKTLGVRNIPTTFINGRSLTGSPPPTFIKGVIEEILEKK